MYAVFRAGGKQYRASEGERLKIEKLDADEGANVTFDEVLLIGEGKDIKVGSPLVSGGSVKATVLRQGRTGKVSVTKFRRRQNYLRQHTHRQWYTEVQITGISGAPAGRKSAAAEKAEPAAEAPANAPAEASAKAAEAAEKKAAGKKTAKKKATKSAAGKKTAKKAASKKTSE